MKYTVIFASGKVLCFYNKTVAELYVLNYNGTMLTEEVLNENLETVI